MDTYTTKKIKEMCDRGEIPVEEAIRILQTKVNSAWSMKLGYPPFYDEISVVIKELEGRYPYAKYTPHEILDMCDFGKIPISVAIRALRARLRSHNAAVNNSPYYVEGSVKIARNIDAAIRELETMQNPPPAETLSPPETPPPPTSPVVGTEPAPDVLGLSNDEYLKKMVDTGFIMLNTYLKDRDYSRNEKYIVKTAYTVLDVFDELAKMTGSEKRARAIMLQNMSGVKTSLDKHRPKHSLKN
jgi:hypothetical protein